jgi:DNA-binding transcriptional MerR regulator
MIALSTPPALDEMRDRFDTVDELIECATGYAVFFLPENMPRESADTPKLDLNERLVRHYISIGLIDKPEKAGRENRYTLRHLLQMLVFCKARATMGLSAKALEGRLQDYTNDQLHDLLILGIDVALTPRATDLGSGNLEALAKIEEIRHLSDRSPTPSSSRRPPAELRGGEAAETRHPSWWRRYPLLPDLELFVRDDFRLPSSPAEEMHFIHHLIHQLRKHSRRTS